MKKILILLFFLPFLSSANTGNTPDSVGYIVRVGEMCPDFSVMLTDGTTTSIRKMRGKVVMLQFTASWCSVCRREMPFIESDIWKKYKDRNFALVGIDRDEPVEKVEKFGQEIKVTYPLAIDPEALVFRKFADKEAGVTRNVIVDPEGRIVMLTRLFEKEEFDRMVEKIGKMIDESEAAMKK